MTQRESFEALKNRIKALESELEVIKTDKERLEMILSSPDTGLSLINPDHTTSWVNDTILLQQIMETSPVGITMVDEKGNISMANARAEEILGLERWDIFNRRYNDHEWQIADIHGNAYPDDQLPFVLVKKTEKPVFGIRHSLVCPDGKRVLLSINAAPLFDSNRKFAGMVSALEDITERMQSELALHKSEARFQSYIEHAPLGVFVTDAQGRYIDVNPAAERITGYTAGQLTTMRISDLLTPQGMEDGLRHFKTLVDTGQAHGDIPFCRADGSAGYWTVSATRIGPDRYLGFVEDITDRKEREERITLFGRMLDEAPAGITIHDTEGRFLFSNRQNRLMHGYEREEEFLAIDLQKLDVPESKALLAERFRKIAKEGEARFEVGHFRRDGSTFNLEVTAKTIDWHGKTAVLSIATDITERKRAEKALQAERDQLLSLFNSIDEVIYIADLQTHELLYINRYLADMLPENCLGGKCYKVLQDLDAPCSFCTNDIILGKKPEAHRWEYYNPFLDRHFAIVDRVIRWSDSRDVRFEMAVDISAIKKAEAEGEKLQAQLLQAQKMESVGRLAGGVAHDFNNMLGVILGHAEFALEKAAQDQDLCNDLREIQTAARRSADLTKQLLTFARKQTISPIELDLNDTVESMMKMLRRLIGEDIDLAWQPDARLWPVKMDPSQIDQILANLCVNARDAISGVGWLTIETCNHTFDEAYCSEHPGSIPGDYVLLAVSDNGCGMDKNILNHLFEPFFTTKDVGQGTGLGLATVYGIVKQNSGFITVYSEPGQGSTFRIYLPRFFSENAAISSIPEKQPISGGTETILVVEDEQAILRMTCLMLERNGYSVISADTPSRAMEKAESHSGIIDLLMTDVVMPEMNGRDLAGKIALLHPEIRFLFMSGYTADVIAHQGILDEGVTFIQKPFSMADLTQKVRKVLDTTPDTGRQ
ncbi:MAG: PAS domain S-box protein [Proteobacteria bacterium]|nr:PAS domain S-box protein [Pseudomonadota bacterium]